MKPGCPSDFALEDYLLDPAHSAVAGHVTGCTDCASRLARMDEEQQFFRAVVRPATIDAILEEAAPARKQAWWKWLLPAIAVPALAGLAVIAVPHRDPEPYVGLKGDAHHCPQAPAPSPLVFSIFASTGGAVRAVQDGGEVPASAALRFRVAAPSQCWLSVVSVDSKGQVSHLYPDGAPAIAVLPGATLPGGALLDGVPGVERLFAICAPQPVPHETIARAVLTAMRGGPVQGLPAGALQATMLLKKTQ